MMIHPQEPIQDNTEKEREIKLPVLEAEAVAAGMEFMLLKQDSILQNIGAMTYLFLQTLPPEKQRYMSKLLPIEKLKEEYTEFLKEEAEIQGISIDAIEDDPMIDVSWGDGYIPPFAYDFMPYFLVFMYNYREILLRHRKDSSDPVDVAGMMAINGLSEGIEAIILNYGVIEDPTEFLGTIERLGMSFSLGMREKHNDPKIHALFNPGNDDYTGRKTLERIKDVNQDYITSYTLGAFAEIAGKEYILRPIRNMLSAKSRDVNLDTVKILTLEELLDRKQKRSKVKTETSEELRLGALVGYERGKVDLVIEYQTNSGETKQVLIQTKYFSGREPIPPIKLYDSKSGGELDFASAEGIAGDKNRQKFRDASVLVDHITYVMDDTQRDAVEAAFVVFLPEKYLSNRLEQRNEKMAK